MRGARFPLVKLIPPESDESIFGYLVRVAKAASYETLPWCVQLFNAESAMHVGTDARLLRRVAEATQQKTSVIEPMMYGQVGTGEGLFRFGSARITRHMLRVGVTRVCPACLRENLYRRRAWDHAAYIACHVHRVFLLSACSCGAQLRWQFLDRCHECEVPYAEQVTVPVTVPLDAHAEIAARSIGQTTLEERFASIELTRLLNIFNVLGGLENNPSQQLRARWARHTDFPWMDAGCHSVAGGWEGFVAYLMRLTEAPGAAIDRKYRRLSRIVALSGGVASAVVDEPSARWATEFLAAQPEWQAAWKELARRKRLPINDPFGDPVAKRARRRAIRKQDPDGSVPPDLVRHLDIGRSRKVARRARPTIVPVEARPAGAEPPPDAGPAFEDLIEAHALPETLTMEETAARLAISRGRLPVLAEANLLVPRWNAEEMFADLWVYQGTDVATFFQRVVQHGSRAAVWDPDKSARFAACFPKARCVGLQFARVVQAMMAGELRIVGLDRSLTGIGSLVLDRGEAASFLEALRREGQQTYTVEELAGLLSIPERYVCRLIAARLLPGMVRTRDGRPATLVTKYAVDEFRSRYLLGHELGEQLLASSSRALGILRACKLRHVTNPMFGNEHLYVYRRHHLASPVGGRLLSRRVGARDIEKVFPPELLRKMVETARQYEPDGGVKSARAVAAWEKHVGKL